MSANTKFRELKDWANFCRKLLDNSNPKFGLDRELSEVLVNGILELDKIVASGEQINSKNDNTSR